MKPEVELPIYVLGVGCIASSGYGPEQILAAVKHSQEFSLLSGDESTRAYPKSPVEISNFDPADYLTMRGLRQLSRASCLCCVAAAAALDCSTRPSANQERHAVIVGTQWGSIEPLVEFNRSAAMNGVRLIDPGQFPNVVVNVHAGYLGILFRLGGPNVTICGQSASLEAVGLGLDMLQLGRADRVLAGGVEALGPTILDGLQRLLKSSDNAPPGEGAAFLLLSNQIM